MPIPTMCHGTDCPMRMGCHRFTAKPADQQTYFDAPPVTREWIGKDKLTLRSECEYYVSNGGRR